LKQELQPDHVKQAASELGKKRNLPASAAATLPLPPGSNPNGAEFLGFRPLKLRSDRK
jgi:hypothetical protein